MYIKTTAVERKRSRFVGVGGGGGGFERMGIPRRTAHVVIWQNTEALTSSKKIGGKNI